MTTTQEPLLPPVADVPAKKAAAKKAAAKKAAPKLPRADAPPAEPRGPGRPSRDEQLAAKLADSILVVVGISQATALALGQSDGPGSIGQDLRIVAEATPALAEALVKVADTNPALKRALTAASSGSAYGDLFFVVVGGILLPIAANHGLFGPAPVPGPSDASPPVS